MRSAVPWRNACELEVVAYIRSAMAREYLHALVVLGVVDMAQLFGAMRYRLAKDPPIRADNYLRRIDGAKEALAATSHDPAGC